MFVVLDDSLIVCMELEANFQKRYPGVEVKSFTNATDFLAFESFDQVKFASIDFNLPDMTGVEVIEALQTRGFSFPLMLMTANTQTSIHDKCKILGVSHLAKPMDRGEDYQRFQSELTQILTQVSQ